MDELCENKMSEVCENKMAELLRSTCIERRSAPKKETWFCNVFVILQNITNSCVGIGGWVVGEGWWVAGGRSGG